MRERAATAFAVAAGLHCMLAPVLSIPPVAERTRRKVGFRVSYRFAGQGAVSENEKRVKAGVEDIGGDLTVARYGI